MRTGTLVLVFETVFTHPAAALGDGLLVRSSSTQEAQYGEPSRFESHRVATTIATTAAPISRRSLLQGP